MKHVHFQSYSKNADIPDLDRLKSELLDRQIQLILLDGQGGAISSDDVLFEVDCERFHLEQEDLFVGIMATLSSLSVGEELSFSTIETSFGGRSSIYDFQIKRLSDTVTDKRYALLVYDLMEVYQKVTSIRQERNEAKLFAEELAAANRRADEALSRERKVNQDLKKAQAQLIQNEKMASIGQLTAGLAHEINNPLNFIYNGVVILRDSFHTLTDEQKNLIHIIEQGSFRIKEVVKGLQLFNTADDGRHKTVDLHQNLDATIELLTYKINSKAKLEKSYDEAIGNVSCNPSKLNQVFMNLLLNASDFLAKDQKGRISVTTRKVGEDQLHIQVEDNGIGMSPEVAKQVFNPFFTTKEAGVSKGLGLTVSAKIIQEHKGSLSFTTEEGKGSLFKIILPIFGL